MRRRVAAGLALVAGAIVLAGLRGPGAAAAPRQVSEPELRPGTTAAARYEPRRLRGFDVRVHPALLTDAAEGDLGARALDALERDLAAVVDRVPAAAVGRLRAVPIFLSVADPVTRCACYHPSAAWLERHRYDPAKARSIELASASLYLADRALQPSLVLHELAHALHDRWLRAAEPRIAASLERARRSGEFDDVLRASGARDRHYALTNTAEYFAETSEALYGVNDFWPFVRAELESADPEGARLVLELWSLE